MLNPVHTLTHEHLQLGEGVLLRGSDLDSILRSADPASGLAEAIADPTRRLGATKEGSVFRCVPAMTDMTRGQRTPAEGETLAGPWAVSLSGTLMEITPENAALLLGVEAPETLDGRVMLSPEPATVAASAQDVCWVGDTGSGMLAILLFSPVNTCGMTLRANRNGLGEMPFTLLAQKRDPADAGLPCRLLWLTGGAP